MNRQRRQETTGWETINHGEGGGGVHYATTPSLRQAAHRRRATELSHAWAVAERGWGAVGMGALMALAFGTNHHDLVMQGSGVAIGAFAGVQVWLCQKRLLKARC